MSSLPELEELWTEIERTLSRLLPSTCDAFTQTLGVGDAVANVESNEVIDAQGWPRGLVGEYDLATLGAKQRVDVLTQTEFPSNQSKAVGTEQLELEMTTAVSHGQVEALSLLQEMQECAELERVSIEQQQRILALEVQLHELGDALKASDVALERVRGERDVLGDEMALLQTKIRMLEQDEMERNAEVEEERIQQSLEIADLIEMIYRHAPWVTRSKLSVKSGSNDTESLKNLCTMLIEDIKQWRSNCAAAMLDRTRFDSLVSESEGMAKFLCEQGPSAGFVETDLREIQNWEADTSHAASNVDRIMTELLTTWQHVGARECSNVIKRRQRTLNLLLERLGGSTAPRYKVKALKAALTQFLEVDGVKGSEPTRSHASLRPSPHKTYARPASSSAAAGHAPNSLSSLSSPRYLESSHLRASTPTSPGTNSVRWQRRYSPDRDRRVSSARVVVDNVVATGYLRKQDNSDRRTTRQGKARPASATSSSAARSGRVAPGAVSAPEQTRMRREAQNSAGR